MSVLSGSAIESVPTTGNRGSSSVEVVNSFDPADDKIFTYTGGRFLLNGEPSSIAEEDISEVTFLGAKVFSFNASLGYQGNRSECSISVVEDVDDPVNNRFIVPVVGSPQFFEVFNTDGDLIWKFYGLVRSISREVDASRRSFTVQLESPNVILDSVSLIMSEFVGEGYSLSAQGAYLTPFTNRTYNWNQVYNVINIFGFWENDQYGTAAAGYGQSEINEAGIPWKKVVIALNEIINRTHTNDVQINDGNNVLGGSLAFSSTSYSNGKPYLYCLNFDSIVLALVEAGVPDNYRISNVSSISQLISDLAELANLQWFCTLEKNDVVTDTYNGELCSGIIKIHAISLRELPRLDAISDFGISQEGEGVNIDQNKVNVFPDAIGAYDITDDTHILENSTLGLELADVATGKVVIGAKRSAMFEYLQGNIYMYWGSLKPRQPNLDDLPLITPLLSPISMEDVIPIDIRDIVGDVTIGDFKQGKKYWNGPMLQIPPAVYKGIYYASVMELRFAAIDYDNWESYLTNFCLKKGFELGIKGETRPLIDRNGNASLMAVLTALKYQVNQDNMNMTREALLASSASFNDSVGIKNLQALYDKLVEAFSMYGKEFMVPMPVTAYKWVSETSDFESEWDISDSAYTDISSGPNSPNFDPKFLTENGRTVSYAIFPSRSTVLDARGISVTGALDFSTFDGENVSVYGNSVYVKTSVDNKVYYIKQGIPALPWSGEYTYYDGSTSFFYPEILTAANPFLGELPYGRPTNEFFGYYTDLRGALPFAHVSLPSPVFYMKDAMGLSRNYDGIGMIIREIQRDTVDPNNGVGTDREQAPIAEGAAFPMIVSLPLQSNRHHYGPWLPRFNQNVAGRVEVEFDENLAPENFSVGGYGYGFDAMDALGYAKAMPDNIGYFATESGSFTVPGVSRVDLGSQIVAGGPYLTDISVSIDSATVKTTFSMKTWNLDFGKMKRHFMDRILRLSRTQVKVNKSKRDTMTRFESMVRNNNVAARYRGQSSSTMIAATVQPTAYFDPWQKSLFDVSQVTAAIMPAHNMMSHIRQHYDETAVCSLDAMYVPITLDPSYSGVLPKMHHPRVKTHGDAFDLNGYVQSGWIGQHHFQDNISNIHSFTRGSTLPPDLSIKHSMGSLEYLDDPYAASGVQAYNIRTVANRVPQMAVGWGFTVNGDYSVSGVDKYKNPSTWNAGPELRVWDHHKGIWLGDFPVMTGLLRKKMTAPTTFGTIVQGEVIRYTVAENNKISILDKAGTFSKVYCDDPSIGELDKGSIIFYSCVDGKNRILYAGCSVDAKALEMVVRHG
jgi:hypothetical protein